MPLATADSNETHPHASPTDSHRSPLARLRLDFSDDRVLKAPPARAASLD
ncbi:hypothetical protein ACFFQF_07090 [Haladaptatus pallidirubidus]|nr:hypothetical protein [Haladaptatus pallidirubidus]